MKTNHLALSLIPLLAWSCSSHTSHLPPAHLDPIANNTNPPMLATNATGKLGAIERLDPAIDALLAPDAKVEILVDNVQWAEGPVWVDGGLNFSDVKQNTMYRWTRKDGVKPYLQPSGYTDPKPRGGEPGSNGLTLDLQGRIVMCQHGNRRVARLQPDGSITPIAETFGGKRFNSPNDLCFDSQGNLYFTDPPYGLEGMENSPNYEMKANGVYFVTPDGEMKRLPTTTINYADGTRAPLNYPNGVALSPDEKTLYIAVSDPKNAVVVKYDLQSPGGLSNGRVFFDAAALAAKKLPGLPDGLKLDIHGNMWIGGPGGILILSPAGKHLGTLATGVPTANCAWGEDGSTLFICANHNVCRIRTKTKGVALPRE